MASDISLTAAMRKNLLSLQQTSDLMSRTQTRLSTGKKINSAIDGPTAYFASQALTSRAKILDGLKDAMDQSISTIEGASKGIEAITELIEQAKGLATQIQSAGQTEALALGTQYSTILSQLDDLAADSGYQGKNLLGSDTITVKFEGAHNLVVTGFNAASSSADNGLGIQSTITTSTAADAVDSLDEALVKLRTESSKLSANLSIITTRMNFTKNISNVLTDGSDKLTLADTNEEGANMLMLQTRQSLGTTALSLASQAAQSVLQLFG